MSRGIEVLGGIMLKAVQLLARCSLIFYIIFYPKPLGKLFWIFSEQFLK